MRGTLIKNVKIPHSGGQTGWVLVKDGMISMTGFMPDDRMCGIAAENVVDGGGAWLMPGVIDCHVHFRDPGLTRKGDMSTESRAAVAGGVTSYMDMPNTVPQTTTSGEIEHKLSRASEVSLANHAFFIGATNDNLKELLKADYSIIPGVKLFLGSSTGNMLVDHARTLDAIFSEVEAVIAVHAEDETIIASNRDRVMRRYGEDAPVELHTATRSAEACYRASCMAAERADHYGARLHLCHLSTARELSLLSAGCVSGKSITAEVSPHHLWWTDNDYATLGARIKMNPSIKTADDRQALRRGLADGKIDIVATDHAPHLLSEKAGGAFKAVSGAPMVQFSLPLMLEILPVDSVVEKMCHNPHLLYGIDRRGMLRPGFYADLVLVEECEPYVVEDSMVLSRCGWTPLAGAVLHHRVVSTWVNGHLVYDNGRIDDSRMGMALKFKH